MSSARELRADCSRCAALCCVVPAFVTSVDFAIDKPAGEACRHLLTDDRCSIHDRLRPAGFRGCVVFDCFGAGQRICAELPAAKHWRQDRAALADLQALLPRVRHVHELLWHLDEVVERAPSPSVRLEAQAARRSARRLPVDADADTVAAIVGAGGELLDRASQAIRSVGGDAPRSRRGADLLGRDLRRTALTRLDLRNAVLIAADLRGADLDRTDLLGADLRDADLRGADLSAALFVTQPQLDAARGDMSTALPVRAHRPEHW